MKLTVEGLKEYLPWIKIGKDIIRQTAFEIGLVRKATFSQGEENSK